MGTFRAIDAIGSQLGIRQPMTRPLFIIAAVVACFVIGVLFIPPGSNAAQELGANHSASESSEGVNLELPQGLADRGESEPSLGADLVDSQETGAGWWEDERLSAEYLSAFRAAIRPAIRVDESDAPESDQLAVLKSFEQEIVEQTAGYFDRIRWEELGEVGFQEQAQYLRQQLTGLKDLRARGDGDFERQVAKLDRAPFQYTPTSAISVLSGSHRVLSQEQREEVDLLYWRALGARASVNPDLKRFEQANFKGMHAIGADNRFPYEWEYAPAELLEARARATEIEHRYLLALEEFVTRHELNGQIDD